LDAVDARTQPEGVGGHETQFQQVAPVVGPEREDQAPYAKSNCYRSGGLREDRCAKKGVTRRLV
jgi:hypothetical protein